MRELRRFLWISSQIMYLLLSSGILTLLPQYSLFTCTVHYFPNHELWSISQCQLLCPTLPYVSSPPPSPRIYHIQLSILINFLSVLTLLHEDSQFNKYDKNITFCLLLAYFHGTDKNTLRCEEIYSILNLTNEWYIYIYVVPTGW